MTSTPILLERRTNPINPVGGRLFEKAETLPSLDGLVGDLEVRGEGVQIGGPAIGLEWHDPCSQGSKDDVVVERTRLAPGKYRYG